MQSLRQIGLKLWKIGAVQNEFPIVVYGVMSDRESKKPWPLLPEVITNTTYRSVQNKTYKLVLLVI